jgi:hypothetical protein
LFDASKYSDSEGLVLEKGTGVAVEALLSSYAEKRKPLLLRRSEGISPGLSTLLKELEFAL